MPSSANRNLFLQVGADVTPLQAQMKAGRTAILGLAEAAGDVQAAVQKQLAAISADPNSLRQLESSYRATFDNIRRNAQAALAVNDNASALKLLDATGAQQAAAAASAQAAQLRIAADAAAAVAMREGEAGLAARVLAAALEVQAVDAQKVSAALSAQADVMAEVAAEAKVLGAREDEVSGAHTRMGASGLIAEHVIRSFSDSVAAGQSPVRAFTMEMGRISEAVILFGQQSGATEGKMAAFAGFMGGPWGLAISVGVAVLTPLIAKLFEGNETLDDAVRKLKDDATQTALTDAAHRAFSRTIEGEIAIQKKLNDELDKQVRTERQNQQEKLLQARTNLGNEQAKRPSLVSEIATQQQVVDNYKKGNLPAGVDAYSALSAAAAAEQKVASLRKQLRDLDASITQSGRAVREAEVPLIDSEVQASLDAKTAATLRYTMALGRLRDQLAIGAGNTRTITEQTPDGAFKDVTLQGINEQQYRRQLAALEAAKKKAEEDAALAKKAKDDTAQVGVDATVADATRIIQDIGGKVTSGLRTHEKQEQLYADKLAGRHDGPVAKPGTSDHERGQAIDVAYGPGISIGTIKQAFREAGVHIRQLIDEPGQHAYHVAFGRKGRAGPSEETLAKREQAKVTRAANDDRAFTNADRQADDAIARAKLQLSGSIEDEYKLKVDQITADTEAKNRALQDEVTAKRYTQAQADQLKWKNTESGILQQQIAAEQRRVALANDEYASARDQSNARLALLQIDAALADTRTQRLKIEREILDEQQKARRQQAQNAVDTAKPGSPEQERAQATLDRLPAQNAAENKGFDKDHEDDFQKYRDQLVANAGDMNDALKSVEAHGLKSIEDGLVGIISGTESAAQAFKQMASSIISDLFRIGVEKAIIGIFGWSTGGVDLPGHATGYIPGFAGGVISGPGSGTSDSILAYMAGMGLIRVSNGESIMTARATQRYAPVLRAMNDNSLPGFADGMIGAVPTSYPALPKAEALRSSQHVAVTTAVTVEPSPLFEVQSRTIAQQTVGQAAGPIMAGATSQTMKKLRRQALPGGYG